MILLASTALSAALALASPTPAPAAAPAALEYEAGIQHETLTNNYPNWDTQYLRLMQKSAGNQTLYVQFDSTNRFDKEDNQATLGAYIPLSKAWMFFGEGSASDTHHILPSSSLTAGVQYNSGSRWFEGLAARHVQYDAASVNAGVFSLEHYWNRYRLYYAMTVANVAGTGTDVEHSVEFDTYYDAGQHSFIGVGYVAGREVDNVGLPALLTSHVHGFDITGRHWIDAHWGFVYGAESLTQGQLYRRAGEHVGLDYRF